MVAAGLANPHQRICVTCRPCLTYTCVSGHNPPSADQDLTQRRIISRTPVVVFIWLATQGYPGELEQTAVFLVDINAQFVVYILFKGKQHNDEVPDSYKRGFRSCNNEDREVLPKVTQKSSSFSRKAETLLSLPRQRDIPDISSECGGSPEHSLAG